MPRNPLADEVWNGLTALVFDNRDSWRRAVVEQTGLPFSRVRVLRRLGRQPMTVKEVAQAATLDAPAATVAVNDLEERGLVVRAVNPANRRCKTVSLTEAERVRRGHHARLFAGVLEAHQGPGRRLRGGGCRCHRDGPRHPAVRHA